MLISTTAEAEAYVFEDILHAQNVVEDIKDPEGIEQHQKHDHQHIHRLGQQQALDNIIPSNIKAEIYELNGVEEADQKNHAQHKLKEQ